LTDEPKRRRHIKDAVAPIYDAVGFHTLDLGGFGEAWRVDGGKGTTTWPR